MKKIMAFGYLATLFVWASILGAQQKPHLTEINFLGLGENLQANLEETVTIELKFDTEMDTTINPVVRAGLKEPFTLNVPAVGKGWTSTRIWQGFFTVSNNVPETGDGEYIFQISTAASAAHMEMDITLSTDLGKTLFICRSGELELKADTLDFGRVNVGLSTTQSITINNNSCADLVVSNITVPAPFSLINSPSSFTIPGNGSKILTILFSSNNRMSYSGTITIHSNDRAQSTHTVQLIAKTYGPKIVLAPGNILSFGKVEVGSSSSQPVLVTNASADDASLSDTLHVTNISSNGSIYTVSASKLTIPPDSTQRIEVTFKPVTYTLYNNFILSFNSDDSTQPLRTIRLDGDARDETPPPPLSNVTVSWSNYHGFTNAQNLAICWDNPADPSGIAEIWWKFTTSPTPPQFATDTTRAGGRIILANGSTCANLALFGKLYTSGLWYCYLWLVDSSGNSGWDNSYLQSFVYDITPPGVPSLLGRTVPELQWFGENTTFKLTIGIPIDPFRRTKDAAEVRWKFKSPPSSATDYIDGGRYIFQSPNP
ncbi:MAG: choice-of-anchor D domain-containing protein, partial [bacterium]